MLHGFVMSRSYFVYEGVEVIKTGRFATRKINAKTYSGPKTTEEVVFEISPIPRAGETQWKRWVREEELFTIQEADDVPNLSAVEPPELPVENDVLNNILSSMRRSDANE